MRLIRTLKHDAHGSVLMLTGLMILFLFAIAGAGVDFGRQQLVRMKLQNASDAAAVAAASMPEGVSADQRRQVALRYYNLNYPASYLGVERPSPNIQIGDTIIVDATTTLATNFIANVGVQQLESRGRTVVDRSAPETTIYDVILVLDNSRSMADATTAPRFTPVPSSMQQQALTNVRSLVCYPEMTAFIQRNGYCTRNGGYRVPMPNGTAVQYTSGKCISDSPRNYCELVLSGTTVFSGNSEYPAYGILGNSRLNALRNVALSFVNRIINEGVAGSRIGIVTWSSNVINTLQLTDDADRANNIINQMAGWGATAPVSAMQQAISVGNSFNASHVKAVVFMSDGKPTAQSGTTCDGRTFCMSAVNTTLPLCNQLKSNGVQIYTVGFLNPNDPEFTGRPQDYQNAQNFLRNCASVDAGGNPRYYGAQNGIELERAFTQILGSLGRIRISQ